MGNDLLILIQGEHVAASRYRILQYVPYLEQHGIRCAIRDFPGSVKDYLSLYSVLPHFDCVFVQRKRFHFPFLTIFRKRARKVVYDLDDAVMYRNSLAGSPYSRTRQKRFEDMVRSCDVVIAGNTFLKEQTSPFHSRVVVIPTSIPAGRYRMKDHSMKKDLVTLGWIGDHGSIHYLERLSHVWDAVGRRYTGKVELKIICDTFFDCKDIPVRKVSWSGDTEVAELMDMDIGLMPLLDDPWSWGKCGLKILQYFGVGVPAVCTPVGVNRDVVVDGENGFWAMNDQEWIDRISRMIEDSGKREFMGYAGRSTLDRGYTLEANAARVLEAISG